MSILNVTSGKKAQMNKKLFSTKLKVLVFCLSITIIGCTGEPYNGPARVPQLVDYIELRRYFNRGNLEITPANYSKLAEPKYSESLANFDKGVIVKGWKTSLGFEPLEDILLVLTHIKSIKFNIVWDQEGNAQEMVSRCVQFYNNLEELDIAGCRLDDQGLQEIVETLPAPDRLKTLNIEQNSSLSAAGLKVSLPRLTRLQTLKSPIAEAERMSLNSPHMSQPTHMHEFKKEVVEHDRVHQASMPSTPIYPNLYNSFSQVGTFDTHTYIQPSAPTLDLFNHNQLRGQYVAREEEQVEQNRYVQLEERYKQLESKLKSFEKEREKVDKKGKKKSKKKKSEKKSSKKGSKKKTEQTSIEIPGPYATVIKEEDQKMRSYIGSLPNSGLIINGQDRKGNTDLHLAIMQASIFLSERLKELGIDIGSTDVNSSQYLTVRSTIRKSYLPAIRDLLIKNSSLVNTKNRKSDAPLHLAALRGHTELVQYLIDQGADKEAKDKDGRTPLHLAALRGHTELVQYLIDQGADKEAKDNNGQTLIHYGGNKEVVQYLINQGADIEAKDSSGETPLHRAAGMEELELVQYLIEQGANKEARDNHGRTPLHRAVEVCISVEEVQTEIAKYLIDKGANKEAKDNDSRTPLHRAVLDDHTEIAKYLIDKGANKEAKDNDGRTPLHRAVLDDHTEIAKYLIDKGADKEAKDNSGKTPLHRAARNGYIEIAKYLIDKGAKKDAKDKYGRTPLHRAAENGYTEIAKYLIDKGADKDAKDNDGRTPLHRAVENGYNGYAEIAKYLIDKGANKEAKDKDGNTPLHRAAELEKLEIAKYLIDKGANKEARDNDGRTPLHRAAENGYNGYTEIAKYLIDKGANKDAKDNDGRTPLHLAADNGYTEIVKLLLNKGVNIKIKDKDGRTAQDIAKQYGRYEIKSILKRANIS